MILLGLMLREQYLLNLTAVAIAPNISLHKTEIVPKPTGFARGHLPPIQI